MNWSVSAHSDQFNISSPCLLGLPLEGLESGSERCWLPPITSTSQRRIMRWCET
jgi:hypothetical protein